MCSLSIPVPFLCYHPPCHYCFPLAVIFKFMSAKILLRRCKQMTVAGRPASVIQTQSLQAHQLIIRHVNLLSDRRSLTQAWECHSILYFVRELFFFSLVKCVTFVSVLDQVLCNRVIRSSIGGYSVLYSIFSSNWLSNVWCPITSRCNGPLSVIQGNMSTRTEGYGTCKQLLNRVRVWSRVLVQGVVRREPPRSS